MTSQACTVFIKEYKSNIGVLTIENIFNQNKSKGDIIREIIESEVCLGSRDLMQSTCRNRVENGDQAKEETT